MITVYSTGCPKCHVLLKKLAESNVEYKIISDTEEMKSLGITTVPMILLENGELMNFNESIKWLKER